MPGNTYPIGGSDGFVTGRQAPQIGLREGQILDETYRIVRRIGEGGMGVVYEATHARLAGRYAIKVLLRRLSDNAEAMARFDREARITSSLQHPNIVQVIDFNKHVDGTEYLVMEYLHGETLSDRLRRVGSLPVDIVVSVVEQVAAGLAAAHSHGVVHRDLKPENIFLLPVEGRLIELAKVLDFGISKVDDTHRSFRGPESVLMGTPEYMSPEQCRGLPTGVDAASDQFALAVITYQMLTGRTPFTGDSVGAVMLRVLHDNPSAMGIDPEVERVVRRGLAKSKERRFRSVSGFAEALRGAVTKRAGLDGTPPPMPYLGGESGRVDLDAAFVGQDYVLRRPRRRWRAVLFAVAAASVTLFFVSRSNGVRWSLPLGHQPSSTAEPPAEVRRPIEVRPIEVRPIGVRPIEASGVQDVPSSEPSPEAAPIGVQATSARATGPRTTSARPTARAESARVAATRARATREAANAGRVYAAPAGPTWTPPTARPAWTSPPVRPAWTPPSARPASTRPLPPDENATLPLDETFGEAPQTTTSDASSTRR